MVTKPLLHRSRFVQRAAAIGLVAGSMLLLCLPNVAGAAQTAPGGYTATDLGTLGGTFSQAIAVNDSGQVVGNFALAGG